MTTPTLQQIASSLSEAQRDALILARGDDDIRITRWEHSRSVNALRRRGLAAEYDIPGMGISTLTPLGLAVRAELLNDERA